MLLARVPLGNKSFNKVCFASHCRVYQAKTTFLWIPVQKGFIWFNQKTLGDPCFCCRLDFLNILLPEIQSTGPVVYPGHQVNMMSTSGCTLEENMRPQRLGTYHLLLACIFLFPGVVHLEGSVMMRSTLTPKKIKGEMVES